IVVPIPRHAPDDPEILELPPLARDEAVTVLAAVLGEERARGTVGAARGRLDVLRRLIATVPQVRLPAWAWPENAGGLLPAILAGSWDERSDPDREALAALGQGQEYDRLIAEFVRWEGDADPPVRRAGDRWQVVSRDDSWRLLHRYLTAAGLNAFERIALEV